MAKTINILVADDGQIGVKVDGFESKDQGLAIHVLATVLSKLTPAIVDKSDGPRIEVVPAGTVPGS